MHGVNYIWESSVFYLDASGVYPNRFYVPVNHLSSTVALKLFPMVLLWPSCLQSVLFSGARVVLSKT